MKLYRNIRVSMVSVRRSLRTGLFAVCFLSAVCAVSGCGSEGELLSGLREEESVGAGAAEETEADAAAKRQGASADIGAEAEEAGRSTGAAEAEEAEQSTGAAGRDAGVSRGEEPAENGEIYVHVCGAVESPGVYALPPGSRFYEAVEAAGGFAEDACGDYLNLAAFLADGSRLEIPTAAEAARQEAVRQENAQGGGETKLPEYAYYTLAQDAGAAYGSGANGKEGTEGESASGRLVNINTADVEELCTLPGIGEGRAKAVIEYREKQGGFQKKEEIMQVSGIGEKMYARMKDSLTVE